MGKLGRVFMLDDDKFLLDMYKELLEKWGYDVFTTTNAYQFVLYAKEMSPDLLILDINMPETNGWEVLEMIKKDNKINNIPVVMLTILNEKELAGAENVSHYLKKPLDEKKLKDIAEVYMGGKKKYDVLLFDEFNPMSVKLREQISKNNWSFFELHDLLAAKTFLKKNTVEAVILGFDKNKANDLKDQLKHSRIFAAEKVKDLDALSAVIK